MTGHEKVSWILSSAVCIADGSVLCAGPPFIDAGRGLRHLARSVGVIDPCDVVLRRCVLVRSFEQLCADPLLYPDLALSDADAASEVRTERRLTFSRPQLTGRQPNKVHSY